MNFIRNFYSQISDKGEAIHQQGEVTWGNNAQKKRADPLRTGSLLNIIQRFAQKPHCRLLPAASSILPPSPLAVTALPL